MTMPTLLRSPRIDLDDLLVRLLDGLLGLPADQHAVHHAGENVVGNHLAGGRIPRARIGELGPRSTCHANAGTPGVSRSQNRTCLCGAPSARPLPRSPPASSPGPSSIRRALGDLSIGILFEQDPLGRKLSTTPAGPAGTGNKPVVLYRSLVRVRQMGIDTGGIEHENHLTRLIGFVVPGVVPGNRALGNDLVFVKHVRNELHRLDCALGV